MKRLALCLLLLSFAAAAARAQTTHSFEDQQIPAGWTKPAAASAGWAVTSAHAADGAYSLRSAPIGDGASASIAWAGDFPEGTLSLMYRMEAEQCCDRFIVRVDGLTVFSNTGTRAGWTEVRKPLGAGVHTIEFTYSKDGSVATGEDAVFIDNVRVGAALPLADPLLQRPGAAIVSSSGALHEMYYPVAPARTSEVTAVGALAFAGDGALHISDTSQQRVFRYAPVTGALNAVASDVRFTQALVGSATQLLGGQASSCGGYSQVYLNSGTVFHSAYPNPCQTNWSAAARSGSDLFVLQGNLLTRRAVATPAGVLQSQTLAYEAQDLAVDLDGTLWILSSSSLVHASATGALLDRYPIPGGQYPFAIAIREDGLLAFTGYYSVTFARPDHGLWVDSGAPASSSFADLAFVPGVVPDADGDTLPLWWEQSHGLDPLLAADAGLDPDGDTLSHAQEYAFKSKPHQADSDGDGARDDRERTAGTHPLKTDTDSDGLSDGLELLELGSNPLSGDTDGDTLPDYYEYTMGLDLLVDDRAADPDADGLTNAQERDYATFPTVPDSDTDGLLDGAEVNTHHTQPMNPDTDLDTLQDGAEVNTHHTNPLLVDSDGDTLGDALEALILLSNPISADSDADGMPDGWEHQHALGLTTANANDDVDGDGLNNGAEFTAGTLPRVADTDRDLLSDGAEVAAGANPLSPDTDGDRLPDGWEFGAGFNLRLADAHRDDDNDGYSVLEEVWGGTSDANASSHPVPAPWSTHQGNARHNGYQAISFPAQLREEFTVATGTPVGSVVFDAGRIFYSAPDAKALVAVDAGTGVESWRQAFPTSNLINPPAAANGRVYVQIGNQYADAWLRAFDGATGAQLFSASHGYQWDSSLAPTLYADHVYLSGGSYGGAYAFNRVTGAETWFRPLPQAYHWTPAVDGAYAYAYLNGKLKILDRYTGFELGSIDDPLFSWSTWVGMAPLIGGYGNVIACQSSHMVNFDIATRAVAWTRTGCNNLQFAAGNGWVFEIQNRALVAVNELTGNTDWTKTFASPLTGNVIVTRQHVIVSDSTHTHVVDLADRSIVTSVPGAGMKTLSADGRLAIATASSLKVYSEQQDFHVFGDSFEE